MKRIYISGALHASLKKEALAEGRTLQWVVENKLFANTPPLKNTELPKPADVADLLRATRVSDGHTPTPQDERDMITQKKIASGATPLVEDLIADGTIAKAVEGSMDKRIAVLDNMETSRGEMDCCQHPTQPCKHWQWDVASGEGYKNILSGRFREAD